MSECLVLAYDDSPNARLALEAAGWMHPGWHAIVAHAWSVPIVPSTAGPAAAVVPAAEASDETVEERRAHEVAAAGAQQATRAGLRAEPAVFQGASAGDIAAGLLSIAAQHSAELIVVGRRGLGRVQAAVLGSVSDELVREAPLPVLVVPGREAPRHEA